MKKLNQRQRKAQKRHQRQWRGVEEEEDYPSRLPDEWRLVEEEDYPSRLPDEWRLVEEEDYPSRLPDVIRVAGDGSCLFRAVAYGACLRSGGPSPGHSEQKQLADDLRNKVVDELIKRRATTEWFVEGDFHTYTREMRKPHTWGGEPELLMASHVLRMPIRVVMQEYGGMKVTAEYGQEYGKESPIQVLYHGYGHYDVLKTSPVSHS